MSIWRVNAALHTIVSIVILWFGIAITYAQPSDSLIMTGLSWNPDGSQIALGMIGRIDILDVPTLSIIGSLSSGYSDQILSIKWSPNGQYIAATSTNYPEVFIWNLSSERYSNQVPSITLLGDNRSSLYHLTWSPDSQRIGGISFDDALLQIWNLDSKTVTLALRGIQNGLDWYENYLTIGVGEGASLYNVDTGQFIRTIAYHPAQLSVIRWSPDGSKIATTGTDGFVRVWSADPIIADDIHRLMRIHISQSMVASVSWSPDSSMIAASGFSGEIVIWNISEDRLVSATNAGVPVRTIEWSPTGLSVAYTKDSLPYFDIIHIEPSAVTNSGSTPTPSPAAPSP
ncbi:MAG: hypothetical protein SF123_13585 [Chloroflexota bacterium]|nr:hypothetical protein [Chloroflexota bacterium]